MFETLETYRTKETIILDTCFVIYELKNQKEKDLINLCEEKNVIMISFTIDELEHVKKKLGHDKKLLKDFLAKAKLILIDVPVKPGEHENERNYVNTFDPELLKKIKDPSDAVLVVAAMKSGSNILTRDKHHLFTTQLREELEKYNLNVFNNLKDVM